MEGPPCSGKQFRLSNMGTILDQFGRPTERFARAVNRDTSRGLVFNRRDESIRKLIPAFDRRALAALSRKVVFNTGIARACINQKAQLVIQESFMPRYHGDDSDAGLRAMDWLEDVFFSEFDYIDARHWRPFWETVSKAIDRDGEAFLLKTIRPEDGRHAVTAIPAYRVRSNSPSYIMGGENDGARLDDGLGYDSRGRVIFYRVYTGEKDFEDIPADRMIHIFDKDFTEQRRGYPAFAASLSDILQGLESKELEILRMIINSSVLLVNKGIREPQATDAGFEGSVNTATGQEITREQVAPGIYYLDGDGQEIDVVTQKTPGQIWESFQSRLWNEAVTGAGWAGELVGFSQKQGTASRAEIVRARLSVRNRFRTLSEGAVQVLTWGLADPRAPRVESMRWTVTRPARLTVDDGREERADLEKVLAGAMSEEEFQANRGKSLREHMTERARTIQTAEEVAAAMSTPERPVRPEQLLAGGGGGTGGGGEAGPSQKEQFDAYGVGVRSGALTPQTEDERHFRESAGLPDLGPQAGDLWTEQGGIRQPITLAPSTPDQTTIIEEDE